MNDQRKTALRPFPLSLPLPALARWAAFAAILVSLLATGKSAFAQACGDPAPRCKSSDGSAARCDDRLPGSICIDSNGDLVGGVDGTCVMPCTEPRDCSLGETCASGQGLGGSKLYCKSIPFTVDLNLVDSCVAHFVNGDPPALDPTSCQLANRLTNMLDQNHDGLFDIDDVDRCIRNFLQQPACDPATHSCPQEQAYCEADATCGRGLYCDTALHRCARDCGLVVDRSDLSDTPSSLDRQCFGRMTTCNYGRGRCEAVDPLLTKCQVDRDCPASAYCMLGTCAPRCYRSIDCPGTNWFCGADNTCQPRPPPSDGGVAFDPRDYAVLFANRQVSLDGVDDHYDVPLLIMNTRKKTQVFNAPEAIFGYRLELAYARKLDSKCDDFAKIGDADRADCLISPEKEFITLLNPFGTIYGVGDPKIGLVLNKTATAKLSPGTYEATLSAIWNTGGSDSIRVRFQKPSPSGEYAGLLSVYADTAANLVGTSNIALRLSIHDKEPMVQWGKSPNGGTTESVLGSNNVDDLDELTDISTGYKVEGILHATSTQIFDKPTSFSAGDNEIPIKGIYSPQLGRIRLLAVYDIAANDCHGINGACTSTPRELQTRNPFGRAIRRYVQLIGPFDATRRVFEGVYRETITGLTPDAVTLDGGFRLNQFQQNDTPIGNWGTPLLAAQTPHVNFPDSSVAIAAASALVQQYCGSAHPAEVSASQNEPAFDAYLAGASLDKFIVLEDSIQTALKSTASPSQSTLTVYEFLRGQLPVCTGAVTSGCIDTAVLRCQVAVFQKALASNWVDPTLLSGSGNTLFCGVNDASANCAITAAANPSLAAYHAHNRVYQSLIETLIFEAGADLSDADYVLFKQATDFGRSSAIAYKQDRLTTALGEYDDALGQFVSPLAATVLFHWPMVNFQNRGGDLIHQAETLRIDRMETVYQLFDARRRLIQSTTDADRAFADHLLQNEFLVQVYFLALEKTWERELFTYSGFDADHPLNPLERGDQLLAKVDETRNPLGLRPDRTYLENSTRGKTNWQNYYDQLREQINGGASTTHGLQWYLDQANAQLKGALTDRDKLDDSLSAQTQDFENQLEALCGDDGATVPLPDACIQDRDDKATVSTTCQGSTCAFPYTCDTSDCTTVKNQWDQGLANVSDVACRSDVPWHAVSVGGRQRSCVRGKLGGLLQEQVSLELQRKTTAQKVNALLRSIARQTQYLRTVQSTNTDVATYLNDQDTELATMQAIVNMTEEAYEIATTTAESGKCMVILGLAAGTDCVGNVASIVAKVAAIEVRHAVIDNLNMAIASAGRMKEIKLHDAAATKEEAQLTSQIESAKTDVESLLADYQKVTQQIFNISIQVQDTQDSANLVARHYGERITNIVDHLVGRETGSVLIRNALVQDADDQFARSLLTAYKLEHAFVHRFNLKQVQDQLDSAVFQIETLADLQKFADTVSTLSTTYCALQQGLDCDYINNSKLYPFDFQTELFPDLRPVVDGKTGDVLSVGEQFHALLTSSAFQRKRDGQLNIEIPFAIWATDQGVVPEPLKQYPLDQNECNHVIVGDLTNGSPAGTMALQVVGSNLPADGVHTGAALRYYMKRGDTDYMRSCDKQTDLSTGAKTFIINTFTVGPPPENVLEHSTTSPPAFVTTSAVWPAWTGFTVPPDGANVWLYFARERSVAAPDWVLVIPDVGGTQKWIFGDGVADASKPTIEDLILYIRHNARPFAAPN